MHIDLIQVLVWILISAIVGVLGELIARRRAPDGIIGATILGFIAIFVFVGLLGLHFDHEPMIAGVPIISSVLIAAVLVLIWSAFAYRRVRPYYARGGRYYRRGSYVRRPRRRRWF